MRVRLLVGTSKGGFLYESDEARQNWQLSGPFLGGWEIYSLLGDPHDSKRIFAGTSHYAYGPTIRVSEDGGESWVEVERSPAYTADSGRELKHIWQISASPDPNTYYAGVEEAGIFVSRDRGATWDDLSALASHPTRKDWFPGNGGLCLHTILVHPQHPTRIWVGISAVGVFRTDDGGATWTLCNTGLPELEGLPASSTVGRCVHKMVLDPANPDALYMQFHGGVLKSVDGAENWFAIEEGLPSNFGFPMGISRTGDLFIIPLESGERRWVPEGKLRVFRSRDRGATWQAVGKGLPVDPQFVGVLRDALTVDALEPAGIYFGTSMGNVYASVDGGETWDCLPGHFPRITTVKIWEEA